MQLCLTADPTSSVLSASWLPIALPASTHTISSIEKTKPVSTEKKIKMKEIPVLRKNIDRKQN